MENNIDNRYLSLVTNLANELDHTPNTRVNTHLALLRARRDILETRDAQQRRSESVQPPAGDMVFKKLSSCGPLKRQDSALTLALNPPAPKLQRRSVTRQVPTLRSKLNKHRAAPLRLMHARPSALKASLLKPKLTEVLPSGNTELANPSQMSPLDPASPRSPQS